MSIAQPFHFCSGGVLSMASLPVPSSPDLLDCFSPNSPLFVPLSQLRQHNIISFTTLHLRKRGRHETASYSNPRTTGCNGLGALYNLALTCTTTFRRWRGVRYGANPDCSGVSENTGRIEMMRPVLCL